MQFLLFTNGYCYDGLYSAVVLGSWVRTSVEQTNSSVDFTILNSLIVLIKLFMYTLNSCYVSSFRIWKKQNRESTEGYSKNIVRKNNDKFGKRIGLDKYNIYMQVPKGRDQVSGGISVPCRHATPVANVLWKSLKIRLKVEFGTKSDQ